MIGKIIFKLLLRVIRSSGRHLTTAQWSTLSWECGAACERRVRYIINKGKMR